jgi:hypothetical protein
MGQGDGGGRVHIKLKREPEGLVSCLICTEGRTYSAGTRRKSAYGKELAAVECISSTKREPEGLVSYLICTEARVRDRDI